GAGVAVRIFRCLAVGGVDDHDGAARTARVHNDAVGHAVRVTPTAIRQVEGDHVAVHLGTGGAVVEEGAQLAARRILLVVAGRVGPRRQQHAYVGTAARLDTVDRKGEQPIGQVRLARAGRGGRQGQHVRERVPGGIEGDEATAGGARDSGN